MLTNKLTGAGAADKTYIEDVFSTYLYTGNGSTQTISNGIQLGEVITVTPGTALAGGYFAGWIVQNNIKYAVIVSPKASGQSSKAWMPGAGAGPAGTITLNNGPAASSSMNSATYPAAQFCEGLSIGGYTDWYLPSRDELEICYRNLKPTTTTNNTATRPKSAYSYSEGDDVSGDTIGINRNSSPNGSAYTSSNPSQTSVEAFKSGGSEAFSTTDQYWSSSEWSSTEDAWVQWFTDGTQTARYKGATINVRAIRRIPVSDPSLDPYRVSSKGGMVWIKGRSGATDSALYDTTRGATKDLVSNSSAAETTQSTGLTSFGSTGFSIGALAKLNTSAATYVSWTFRKAPKFFDVVTYTGSGVLQTINHGLGAEPGMILIKSTSNATNWYVWHRSSSATPNKSSLQLNGTRAVYTDASNAVGATSANFTLYNGDGDTNSSGTTYVAYLFAHDTTTDGLIQCGSYTGNASTNGPEINLGWEPQYILIKNSTSDNSWNVVDNMRGISVGFNDAVLQPNASGSEFSFDFLSPTATGFKITSTDANVNNSGSTYIYMAIRRGPMRTPTDATKVFMPISSNQEAGLANSTGFAIDTQISTFRTLADGSFWMDRLRGVSTLNSNDGTRTLASFNTNAESVSEQSSRYWSNTGFLTPQRNTGYSTVYHSFKRAPGFFDVVCYTGNGSSSQSINHSLGVTPNLVIIKPRNTAVGWTVFWGTTSPLSGYMVLNTSAADSSADTLTSTSTAFTATLGDGLGMNTNATNYVAYLFASCPGVSKVGSYTGNGSSQTINCGFAAGARFVLIKRTDSTGDWYVWDTARGIVTANDPHLSPNTTAAEVTTDDTIDPDSTGFIVNQVTDTNVNVNGGSYIYLAIA